jgi:hypothetical protein
MFNWIPEKTQSKVDATRDKQVLVFKICTSGVTRFAKVMDANGT